MADQDFYAYLYANEGRGKANALFAISMPKNAPRCIPPRHREILLEISDVHSHEAREVTEQPEEYDELLDSPCIGLKFSDGAKTKHGVVMGWAPDCDIVLPKKKGVSRYHAALTFDKENHLIFRDLGSVCGTRVTYDGEVAERRFSINWIVGGVEFVKRRTPILEFIGELQFRLVVPPQDIKSQQYIDNVTRFHQGTADAADLIEFLRIRSLPATELSTPTGSRTPSSRPSGLIHWKKKLGEGVFGTVTHIFNVTTGEEYALKEPKIKTQGGYTLKDWKKEADIMSCIQHVSIDLA